MNNNELKSFLDNLESSIDEELVSFFNNSSLRGDFSCLVDLVVWGDDLLDDDVIRRLDVLTDNMDLFNYGVVKENIVELRELL